MSLPDPFTKHSPAELIKLVDNLWRAEQKLQAMQAKIRPLKDARDALEAELLDSMLSTNVESMASKRATISVKRTQFAELFDHKAFFEYVRKKNAFDLVRKQPVIEACRARWDDKVEIPGVRPGTRKSLSITTRSK